MKTFINIQLQKVKEELSFDIEDDLLLAYILDITKTADKKITNLINKVKKEHNLKITTYEKNQIRDYLLNKTSNSPYKDLFVKSKENLIDTNDIIEATKLILEGLKKNKTKVEGTIKAKLNLNSKKENFNYLNFIKKYEQDFYQLEIIHLKSKFDINSVKETISSTYDKLQNYHNLIILFEGNEIKWQDIADIAVYCEFFKIEKNFNIFNKNKSKKINELIDFLKNNENIIFNENIIQIIKEFYEGVSYGFQFQDLIISEDNLIKILILQKIELDETPLPCPSCYKTIVRGNSYPKLLQKSFECQNPLCPSRSKSGRGKRFDYLSIKRNIYLETADENDYIPEQLVKDYRKDIFTNKNDIKKMLIKFYSWHNNKILYLNEKIEKEENFLNRKIIYKKFKKTIKKIDTPIKLDILFDKIIKYIHIKKFNYSEKFEFKNIIGLKGNSTNIIPTLKQKIKYSITSPPYYNAREYSQWPNLITYFIDMIINAYAIKNKIDKEGIYFYNIGDIVDQENIFISSQMSKRRIMLGFYTMYLFKKIGLYTIDNIIWDKGEVQSKRNSSANYYPGYIKPINCYEHIILFSKNKNLKINTKKILKINPVKKINSKGENILGHTAPYPIELINIILDNCNLEQEEYILDPYLGSGTTLISCCQKDKNGIGIELNEEYFQLAKKRIEESCFNLLKIQ